MTLLVNESLSAVTTSPERIAHQIEGQFFQMLMKEMRATVPEDGLLPSGISGSMYQELFDQALAEKAAKSSNLGLANTMLKQLGLPSSTPGRSGSSQPLGDMQAVEGKITSGYGPRRDPINGQTSFHHGVDIGAPLGQPIASISSGTVQYAGPLGDYGNAVRVMRPDGTEVLYGHCSQLLVSTGQQVSAGTVIAEVGQSGRATGPHLHLEVRTNRGSLPPSSWKSLQLGDPIQVSARSADVTLDVNRQTAN